MYKHFIIYRKYLRFPKPFLFTRLIDLGNRCDTTFSLRRTVWSIAFHLTRSSEVEQRRFSVHRPPPRRVDYTPYLSFFLRSNYSVRQRRVNSRSINYFLRPVPEAPPAPSRKPCRLTSSRATDEKTVAENRACSRLNVRTYVRTNDRVVHKRDKKKNERTRERERERERKASSADRPDHALSEPVPPPVVVA
jgi:hypothetical protein